jgi:hypothetical protein
LTAGLAAEAPSVEAENAVSWAKINRSGQQKQSLAASIPPTQETGDDQCQTSQREEDVDAFPAFPHIAADEYAAPTGFG